MLWYIIPDMWSIPHPLQYCSTWFQRGKLCSDPDKYHKYEVNDESFYLDPISNIEDPVTQYGVIIFDKINYTSLNIGKYQDLKKDAFDWYLFMRDSYEQNRNKEIKE